MTHSIRMAITRLVIALNRTRDWLVAAIVLSLLKLISLLPAAKAIRFVDRVARRIGPMTSRHRLALANLKRAFPEKTDEERQQIALDMWGNMSRLAAEYVFLDQILISTRMPPSPAGSRSKVSMSSVKLRDSGKPFIVFTAHTGNFELLPIAAAAYGLDVMALFRPPNNPYIATQGACRAAHLDGPIWCPHGPAQPSLSPAGSKPVAGLACWLIRNSTKAT
jgi:KDO2-lipid IV(A) lauroyltransferase